MADLSLKASLEEPPFPLTEVDKWVLSLTDEEFHYHDWEDLKKIIGENNLSVLKRKPSELRRYMAWTTETRSQYGSMTNYLLTHRLPKAWGSPPFTPASVVPFDDKSDYSVLINDWPYGLTPDIAHIVVWSRTIIDTEAETGDMTAESRCVVSDFIKRFFIDKLGPEGETKVLWFKNWVSLQSVRTLEHIHVMVKDASKELLDEWTQELAVHRLRN
ncbi:hypothetical protein SAMD00023353_3500740 [Rosellinia necatrix]|uniref:N-acetylglucosamine-induced protein 1 n=1 Tax=Rosellinia necatrix TaxID=77044 RepID=A0A1W2TMT7_ROSNE|nr:hypothetical protein SAMD00023353_3500740 [Rosellinia necatrix]